MIVNFLFTILEIIILIFENFIIKIRNFNFVRLTNI